ncbi:MAG: hypothetical protein MZU84_06045 [Sphingobacterium sp.]|nr:hypothetical protein [Sphingobacterium sp.]
MARRQHGTTTRGGRSLRQLRGAPPRRELMISPVRRASRTVRSESCITRPGALPHPFPRLTEPGRSHSGP